MADLDAIEKDWKTATLVDGRWRPSNVQIGVRHGVTEGYVRKMAKKLEWGRGSALTPPPPPPPPKELLRRPAPATPPPATPPSELICRPAPDTAGMDDKVLSDNLLRRMLDELDTVTAHVGELEDLIESETANDRDGRRRAAMMKAVSLPVRANTLKMLLQAQAEASEDGKKGKKEKQLEAAVKAGGGKFKASAPPGALRVVG